MSVIQFSAEPYRIGSWTILRLPEQASAQLPSRGMAMVAGTINGQPFQTALEPDGRFSHWFRLDTLLPSQNGDRLTIEIEPVQQWWRPETPKDLQAALDHAPRAQDLWNNITPNAQWEWVRWIRGTKQAETRARRIAVAISKLNAGSRRPCCFNRNLCSEPYVSHNWILLEPNTPSAN